MDLSLLSSILAMLSTVNIFYAMYGLMQRNWVNILVPLVTFFILMYSSAIIDVMSRERTREREMQKSIPHAYNLE